ncbi:Flp family type IVb pilin [Candidatus Omnitrophota bacterium]
MKIEKLKTRLRFIFLEPDSQSGQVLIEYVVMFTVIVIAIIFAATKFIQPSMNNLFEKTGDAIDNIEVEFSGVVTGVTGSPPSDGDDDGDGGGDDCVDDCVDDDGIIFEE